MSRRKSDLNTEFAALWQLANRAHGGTLPEPVREFVFAKPRRWRWDFAWPQHWAQGRYVLPLAVELDGGIWNPTMAHGRGSGILRNNEKRNAATLMGWRVLVYTATDLRQRPWQVVGEVLRALGLEQVEEVVSR